MMEAAGIFQKLYWGILYLENEIKNKNIKNQNSKTKSLFLNSLVRLFSKRYFNEKLFFLRNWTVLKIKRGVKVKNIQEEVREK